MLRRGARGGVDNVPNWEARVRIKHELHMYGRLDTLANVLRVLLANMVCGWTSEAWSRARLADGLCSLPSSIRSSVCNVDVDDLTLHQIVVEAKPAPTPESFSPKDRSRRWMLMDGKWSWLTCSRHPQGHLLSPRPSISMSLIAENLAVFPPGWNVRADGWKPTPAPASGLRRLLEGYVVQLTRKRAPAIQKVVGSATQGLSAFSPVYQS
jgi:hypothetical protein